MTNILPWKCPNCTYFSTRNWNVKTHNLIQHGGRGNPISYSMSKKRVRATECSQQDLTNNSIRNGNFGFNRPNSLDAILGTDDTALRSVLFQINDKRDELLYDTLARIAPQFQEMEQLLNSAKIEYPYKEELLGRAVIDALCSDNPIKSMIDTLKTYYLICTTKKMIDCASCAYKTNPINMKKILKSFLPEQK
ncbi:MAG TPA: hypothetical protein VF220_10125 [Nitrososphaeraceae archaeon]